jgi:hypothetical protein
MKAAIRRPLRPYPSRAMLGVWLLLGLCAAATCWNARPGAAQPQGIDLRSPSPTPKVNTTSAETPAVPASTFDRDQQAAEAPVPPPRLELQAPSAGDVPVPSPPPEGPPLVDVTPPGPPPPAVETACPPGSLAMSCFNDLHRGETPMMRNWNILKLSSLLAVALAVTPAPAGPTEFGQVDLKDLKESIDSLNTTLKTLNGNLQKAQESIKSLTESQEETKLQIATLQSSVKFLDGQIKALKGELDKLQERKSLYAPDKTTWDDLKGRLEKIETALIRLAEARKSLSSPGVGRVQLVNLYPQAMLFDINGKKYVVQPGTTVNVDDVPAGLFKYEVIADGYGLLRTNTPTLEAGKTYVITVR